MAYTTEQLLEIEIDFLGHDVKKYGLLFREAQKKILSKKRALAKIRARKKSGLPD